MPMCKGMHSTVEFLAQRLLRRSVPKWYGAFCDPLSGGFYERLGRSFKPVPTGNRRLLTQCRQLALYSHASIQKECQKFNPDLKRHFTHIVDTYYVVETGGWRFSVDETGEPLDSSNDLYTLSFVIFAMSHYFRATKDERAQVLARATLDFIRNNFSRNGVPGYSECLDEKLEAIPKMRRQNPHMHLLEASLFAWETWGDGNYLAMADEMVSLFHDFFFTAGDARDCFLGEYYSEDLSREPEKGNIGEPGHYFEWIWLLKKHEKFHNQPGRHDDACARLLDFANRHGWDGEYGGIYDEFDAAGNILKDSKRLWPFTEAVKANALMLDSGEDKDFIKGRMADMILLFKRFYMDERGFWTEWLRRDLSPATDYMPGTTPYHVYFGVMEARSALSDRGRIKSLMIGPATFAYSVRRNFASTFKRLRKAG